MERKNPVFLSEEEVESYVRMFPRGTMVLIEKVEITCCEGHTFREIMGYDELDH
jgi:hypothetical protein